MNDVMLQNTMLIVDDAEINRDVLRIIFQNEYEIMEAESIEEALQVLEICKGSIDIILLDLVLPGMSGFDFLEKRKHIAEYKKIPVVVITSSTEVESQIKAFELEANDFIAKPFIPEIACSRVDNVMKSNKRMLSIEQEAQQMKTKSELDEMTGILNKATTEMLINETLTSNSSRLNVLFVMDIDHFKTVNDTAGHLSGDHVIKIIANLISSKFRQSDIVGRIGGDEFVVLMSGIPSIEIARMKANEIVQEMRYKPNLTIPEYVTLSVGIASNEQTHMTYADLFKKADEALYQAKENGKACYVEYGRENINFQDDERALALLISSNRSVCGIIQSSMPEELRLIEAVSEDEFKHVSDDEMDKTKLIFVDVSDSEGDGSEIWDKLEETRKIDGNKVFAICQEGNITQYSVALKHGVADMVTSPIDITAIKRRMERQLSKYND